MPSDDKFQVLQRFQDHNTTDEFVLTQEELPVLRMFCRDSVVFNGPLPTYKEWEASDGTPCVVPSEWRNTPMYERTDTSRFLTRLLHNPVYREAHKVTRVTDAIQAFLARPECKNIGMVLVHYVGEEVPVGERGGVCLAATALLHSDSNSPGSCIQGDLTQATNLFLAMCMEVGITPYEVVPISYTTNLSGLHVSARGITNLD